MDLHGMQCNIILLSFRLQFVYEPRHEKTNIFSHKRFYFRFMDSTIISIYFLNPNFPVPRHPLCLYSSVCVGPVRKPHCSQTVGFLIPLHVSLYGMT